MEDYEVVQTLSNNQYICVRRSSSSSNNPSARSSSHQTERKSEKKKNRKSSSSHNHYLITKQYLYSYDHSKYQSEDEKLLRKYNDIHTRIDCLLFLREKDLVNLLDCFYFEQIEKQSKYTDKYFCTVEKIDGIVSLRYLLYKNRLRNKNFQPLKQSLIFQVMRCCLEASAILHAVGEPYFSFSPCNILIEKKTRKVMLRPYVIDKTDMLHKFIEDPHGESIFDPYTIKFEDNKVLVKEFFENQLWYCPPELVFRIFLGKKDKIHKYKKQLYNEIKHSYTTSIAIDIWAMGCIFSEMMLPYPLFSSMRIEDQVINTLSILRLESENEEYSHPRYMKQSKFFNTILSKHLDLKTNRLSVLKHYLTGSSSYEVTAVTLQTISCMMDYEPSLRPPASRILKIPIFSTQNLPNSGLYYRKTDHNNSSKTSGDDDTLSKNSVLVDYVNKVEEEQVKANQSWISESSIANHNEHARVDQNFANDSIYEESIMLASLLNDKSKRKKATSANEQVFMTYQQKNLEEKEGENLLNYLSDNDVKSSSTSFVTLSHAFKKLEKIYRNEITKIGNDIREMKETLGDLLQNSVLPSEKNNHHRSGSVENSIESSSSSSSEEVFVPKTSTIRGTVQLTIERIHEIEYEGQLYFSILRGHTELVTQDLLSKNYTSIHINDEFSKYNNEIMLKITDQVKKNGHEAIVGVAIIDLSPLSYSTDLCGWYNLYDSIQNKKLTGQVLVRITFVKQQPALPIQKPPSQTLTTQQIKVNEQPAAAVSSQHPSLSEKATTSLPQRPSPNMFTQNYDNILFGNLEDELDQKMSLSVDTFVFTESSSNTQLLGDDDHHEMIMTEHHTSPPANQTPLIPSSDIITANSLRVDDINEITNVLQPRSFSNNHYLPLPITHANHIEAPHNDLSHFQTISSSSLMSSRPIIHSEPNVEPLNHPSAATNATSSHLHHHPVHCYINNHM
ncbi:hypothetical protein C9374_002134 [Naegleria lovaniensis]|uniref:Protein kinase domain-containing protein n=1 Tax=Naegleria lovaniensis TaxID=51637 RepID=A0AA88KMM0_NAELO|nr:uncharacterized protein C9374_002134 [Naegleria lovaniensis]KAG2387099.1 hypothetical protein C9374_002134 [Naegleria lovaniensis]